MRDAILPLLACPFCGSTLSIAREIGREGESVEWGLARCECEFLHPILDGILFLATPADPRAEEARRRLDDGVGDHSAWLTDALCRWFPGKPPIAASVPGFAAILDAGGGPFYEYLAYKWGTRSFASGVALLGADRPGLFVDVGCGMGHLAFIRAVVRPAEPIIGVDKSFPLLRAARRFGMIPAATPAALICSDAERPLPVRTGIASTVLVSDGVHYFLHQQSLLREVARVLAEDGAAVLNHVHNARARELEPAQGFSKPAASYVRMLNNADLAAVESFADDDLIVAPAQQRTFRTLPASVDLDTSRTLSFVATRTVTDRLSGPVGLSLERVPVLALNPVYTVDRGAPSEARLVLPSEYFAREHGMPLFPSTVETPGVALSPERLRALVRRLVWIPAPMGHFPPERLRASDGSPA